MDCTTFFRAGRKSFLGFVHEYDERVHLICSCVAWICALACSTLHMRASKCAIRVLIGTCLVARALRALARAVPAVTENTKQNMVKAVCWGAGCAEAVQTLAVDMLMPGRCVCICQT